MMTGTVRVALVVLTLATGWAQNAGGKAETLARWHFAGVQQLKELRNQKSLQQVLDLPETAKLRQAGLAHLGSQVAARYSGRLPQEQQRQVAAAIQQMLGDLIDAESKFLMNGAGDDVAWALAAKLPEERSNEWQKHLAGLARGAGMTVTDSPDWTAAKEGYKLSLHRQKGWTIVTGGASEAKAIADFRKNLDKKLGKAVLDAEFNFPSLGEHFKAPRLAHAPRFVVQASPNKDGFRSEVQLEYPKPLGIKPERWEVPAGLIRESVIGFTAVQGVRELLGGSKILAALQAKEIPNQLFAWAEAVSPFSVYLAADVGNPSTVVTNVMSALIPQIRERRPGVYLGQPQFASNRTAVILRGLPVVVPFIEAGSNPYSEFLVAGLFPVTGSTNSAPAELFKQLNKKNLVYYDWEITEDRLKQLRPIGQLVQILGSPTALRNDAPSGLWIEAIVPKLGNTVTEGTLDGERRIRVVRQSHIGFNALELMLLAHWLDPNDFRRAGDAPQGRAPASGSSAPRRSAPAQTPQP